MRRRRQILGCLAVLAALLPAWGARAGMSAEDSAVGYALEHFVSGGSATLRVGDTAYSVTPLRTWKSVSGHWCRRYRLVLIGPGAAPRRSEATRCRQGGVWRKLPRK